MLYDPRFERKRRLERLIKGVELKNPPPDFKPQPSLRGFIAFVALKQIEEPGGSYNFIDPEICAVGQYLQYIGAYEPDYEDKGEEYHHWIGLAGVCRQSRDEKGRFTKGSKWTWDSLMQSIESQLQISFT